MNNLESSNIETQKFQTAFDLVRSSELLNPDNSITDLNVLKTYYDRSTLSRSNVLIVSIRRSENEKKIAIKKYSPGGFPETEFEAYRLLQLGGNNFVEYPSIYFKGYDGVGSPLLIMDYIEGNRLSYELTHNKNSIQHINYFTDIVTSLEKLKNLGTQDKLTGLVKNSWLESDTKNIKDFLEKGYQKFSVDLKQIVESQKVDSLIKRTVDNMDSMAYLVNSFRHGDIAADNIIVSPNNKISTFLDWEYSFYGPFEKDVADLCAIFLFEKSELTLNDIFNNIKEKGYNLNAIASFLLLRIFIQASVAAKNMQYSNVQKLINQYEHVQSLL